VVTLLWLIISAYFFCQHFYTVKRIDLNKKVAVDNGTIWLEEIVLTNVKKDYKVFEDAPWYYDFAFEHPSKLMWPFMRICYFYSTPYEVNEDFGKIEVKGFLALESPKPEKEEIFDLLDVDVVDKHNVARTSGKEYTESKNSYVYYFSSDGKDFPLETDIFRVNVENEDDVKLWELTFNQTQWKSHTYNDFFTSKPPREEFETKQKLAQIYSALREGNKEEIEDFVLPEAKDQFSWDKLNHQYWDSPCGSYLNYEGRYQEDRDVFTYNITFHVPDDGSADALQKVYLIYIDGVWKIIDVGSVEEVDNQGNDR